MKLNIQDGVLLSAELTENETEINIPEGVTALGPAALAMKRQLRKVTLPSTMTKIAPAAFSGCTGLEELALYEWVFVGSDAFGRCSALRRLEVFGRERKQKDTGSGFFHIPRLPSLREAVLHEGVSEVGQYAFLNCARLENVSLPSTLKKIEGSAFKNCTSLTQIVLPESLDEIGNEAFAGCFALQSVTIPHVREIGYKAFMNCTALKSIALPAPLQYIHINAFKGCTALAQIDLPDSLTHIGGEAFAGCSSLKSVTVPPLVERIDGNVFQGCAALESVTLPPEIRVNGPFSGCPVQIASCTDGTKMLVNWSKPEFAFPAGATRIADALFAGNKTLCRAVWSRNVPVVPYRTFAGCENLKEVVLPEGVTTIERDAFAYAWLERLELPETLKTIGQEAFCCCRLLHPVIPASVETIEEEAFVGIEDVTFLGDLEDIGPLRPQIRAFPKLIRGHAGTNIEKLAREAGAEFEEI